MLEANVINVQAYETLSGICPFEEWLETLHQNEQEIILARLQRIRNGNLGNYKPLGAGLYELKFYYGAAARVYFCFTKKDTVVLLCGGNKKSQASDISLAKKLFVELKKERKYAS